jgi:hypothetical protein
MTSPTYLCQWLILFFQLKPTRKYKALQTHEMMVDRPHLRGSAPGRERKFANREFLQNQVVGFQP